MFLSQRSLLWFDLCDIEMFTMICFISLLGSFKVMEYDNSWYNLIPLCPCGKGKLQVKTAGPSVNRACHLYYICPINGATCGCWKWCDEYHQGTTSGIISKFILNQVYKPKVRMEHSMSATTSPNYEPPSIHLPSGLIGSDFEPLIIYIFMAIVCPPWCHYWEVIVREYF